MATMTAAQRREVEREEYNSYLAHCPSRLLLSRLSDKWVTLVICALGDAGAPVRFSALQRTIAGVSQKMLTQTLRNLEGDGLVERTVVATVPVTVSYELTELGESLLGAVRELKKWADHHVHEIVAARASRRVFSDSD